MSLINVKRVKELVKESNKQVSKGYLTALDKIVYELVEGSIKKGKGFIRLTAIELEIEGRYL